MTPEEIQEEEKRAAEEAAAAGDDEPKGLKEVFAKHGLTDRWNGENDAELLDKALTSYKELEGHKADLVTDNQYWRNLMTQNLLSQKREQTQVPPPQSEDEIAMGRLDRHIQQTVQPQMDQQNQAQIQQMVNYDTNMRVMMAKQDPNHGEAFTELFDSGAIGREVNQRGYPQNWVGIEAAYNAIVAGQRQEPQAEGQQGNQQRRADERRRASMEGAGPRSGEEASDADMNKLRDWAMDPNVSEEEVEAKIMKDFKIGKT